MRRPRATATLGIWAATGALFAIGWMIQPQSVSSSALLGMLPFAAILAVIAAGQTLVVQQGGIDLSVPGMISLGVVMLTRIPNGDDSKLLPAMGLAAIALVGAGSLNGVIVNRVRITPIVTTLGMNALLFGGVMFISGGTPRDTTRLLQSLITGTIAGIPNTVLIAGVLLAGVWFVVKRTVAGRRFEAIGANRRAAGASGLGSSLPEIAAYAGAGFLYLCGAVLLAGVVRTPSAFQGEIYLLPSVAAVVLGGTSLLGGPGSVIATAGGALFLTQLQQLILTTDASAGLALIVQAMTIAGGVAIHSISSGRIRRLLRRPAAQASAA